MTPDEQKALDELKAQTEKISKEMEELKKLIPPQPDLPNIPHGEIARFVPATKTMQISNLPTEELDARQKRDFERGWSVAKNLGEVLVREMGHAISISKTTNGVNAEIENADGKGSTEAINKAIETTWKEFGGNEKDWTGVAANREGYAVWHETALRVSGYAASGPTEFFAESYADVTLHGKKASKDAIALVKNWKKVSGWQY